MKHSLILFYVCPNVCRIFIVGFDFAVVDAMAVSVVVGAEERVVGDAVEPVLIVVFVEHLFANNKEACFYLLFV